MKKFEVFVSFDNTERYDVIADNEQEAMDKALSGDYEPQDWHSEYNSVDLVEEVKEFRGKK